jgi:NinB protein
MASQPKQVFVIPPGAERSPAMNRIALYLSGLGKDRAFKVEVSEQKARRTLSQNALLWALYGDIVRQGGERMAGWETSELHDYFLIEHFGSERVEMLGRLKLRPLRRSSGLSKVEFSEHVDFIVRAMAEHGVVLHLPGDMQ